MTTTANIQADGNTAVQSTNNITEEGTMNHASNNINMVTRLSKGFRMSNIGKLVAGAALGLALTAAVVASGGSPASGTDLATNLNDDFSMVYGIPDTGLELGVVPASFNVAGYGDMSEENLEIVPTSFTLTITGYGDEFGDVELGLVARRVATTIEHGDEFGNL